MRKIARLTLKTSIAPPKTNQPSVHTADFSEATGYEIMEDQDYGMYYVHRSGDGNGVIGIPVSHVVRVEYASYLDSPLSAPKSVVEDGEIRRGPGRPRKVEQTLA